MHACEGGDETEELYLLRWRGGLALCSPEGLCNKLRQGGQVGMIYAARRVYAVLIQVGLLHSTIMSAPGRGELKYSWSWKNRDVARWLESDGVC